MLETLRIGRNRLSENKNPWEEAALATSSHAKLSGLRNAAKTQEEQNEIAPYEHRAYARETVTDSPLAAVPLAAMVPLYQASKAMGFENSRSEASMEQVSQGYKGIGEGLVESVKKPWEEAQAQAKSIIKAVGKLMPWEEARTQPNYRKPTVASPDAFERVFAKLTKQESGDTHTDSAGRMITSNKGAQGITQVMPHTGNDPGYGVEPLRNKSKEEYLRFGRDYLKAMLKEFEGDYKKAVAAYNFGPGGVKKAIEKSKGGDWVKHTPKETRDYIAKIVG
jgi:soluble lytic murein transglycosylase-like protein